MLLLKNNDKVEERRISKANTDNQINIRKIKCHRMRAKQLRDCIAREKIYWIY